MHRCPSCPPLLSRGRSPTDRSCQGRNVYRIVSEEPYVNRPENISFPNSEVTKVLLPRHFLRLHRNLYFLNLDGNLLSLFFWFPLSCLRTLHLRYFNLRKFVFRSTRHDPEVLTPTVLSIPRSPSRLGVSGRSE